MIEEQTNFRFFYNSDLIDLDKKVAISLANTNIDEVLRTVFSGTSVGYRVLDNNFIVLSSAEMLQQINITGVIKDEFGDPMPGVNVIVKGTLTGVVTDVNGKYSIAVPNRDAVLVFSFIGYKTHEFTVGSQDAIDIVMNEDTHQIEEVVVTALGIRKDAKSLGYAFTKVDGDEFTTVRGTNFANSLTAKVAGVNVSSVNNGPSGSSRVTIRGNTSITGDNQPLYVINGLPMNTGSFYRSDGINPDWGDNVSSINPDDIEELTVLKGATAAALYGSRAKNGAIIITTKSGKGSRGIGVEVNSNTTFDVPYYLWELQDEYGQGYGGVRPATQDFAAGHGQNHWGEVYDGKMTMQFDGVERPYSYVKKSVLDDFYSTGFTTTNNVSFTGGGDKGTFRLGLTDMRNKGIISNSTMARDNISLGVSQYATKNVLITANVDYITEHVENRIINRGGGGSPSMGILYVNSCMPTSALAPGYDANLNEIKLGNDMNTTNPYFWKNRMHNESDKERWIASVNVRYNILDWLFIQGKAGQDYYNFKYDNMFPEKSVIRPNGYIEEYDNTFFERNYEAMLGINRNLNEDFGLTVNMGGNMMYQNSSSINISGSDFVNPNLHVLNNTSERTVSTGISKKKINSLFATAELSYKNFLYLNLTGRNDWFSTLNPSSNSFFYPSAGLSFIFTEAFNLPEVFTFGKFRLAYASVGGDTSPYQLDLTYSVLDFTYGGQNLVQMIQNSVPNRNLRPLNVQEYEAGFDVRMFNNRLGFDLAVYNKLTTDDIATESVTTVSGYSGVSVNVGSIRNRGVELLVNGRPIDNKTFSWDISVNMAYNKSKVIKISSESDEFIANASSSRSYIKHIKDMEYSQLVGKHIVKDAQGRDIINADGVNTITDEVFPVGSGVHKYTSGMMNTFTYKGFSLSALIDGKFGAKIYSDSNYGLDHRGMSPNSLRGRKDGYILDGVKADGSVNDIFVTAERVNNRALVIARRNAIDDYLYNASYIKLRNVSLTYNLPHSVLNKIGFLKGASVSLVGTNLAYLMKHTPGFLPDSNQSPGNDQGIESSLVPPVRTYGFNVNLKF